MRVVGQKLVLEREHCQLFGARAGVYNVTLRLGKNYESSDGEP